MADILIGNAPLSILSMDSPIQMKVGEARSFNAGEVIQAPSGRLPITLSPAFPAGSAARYNPAASIKHVEWDFGGDKVRKENVARKFDSPGDVAVTLTVTDVNDEVCNEPSRYMSLNRSRARHAHCPIFLTSLCPSLPSLLHDEKNIMDIEIL